MEGWRDGGMEGWKKIESDSRIVSVVGTKASLTPRRKRPHIIYESNGSNTADDVEGGNEIIELATPNN